MKCDYFKGFYVNLNSFLLVRSQIWRKKDLKTITSIFKFLFHPKSSLLREKEFNEKFRTHPIITMIMEVSHLKKILDKHILSIFSILLTKEA